jgi:hypothetical protein
MKSGTELVDQMTRIAGPSAAELRRPYSKTAAEQARDATLNWGRNGETTVTAGHGDTPAVPESSAVASQSAKTISTEPSTLGSSIKPVRNEGTGNWNMDQLCDRTKIW